MDSFEALFKALFITELIYSKVTITESKHHQNSLNLDEGLIFLHDGITRVQPIVTIVRGLLDLISINVDERYSANLTVACI